MKRRIHLSESFTYRHQFYQQTLTLIETNAPENFVKSGVFYYCNDENNTGYTVCDSMDTLQNVYFIDSYEKAMAEAAGKDPEVVLISGDQVRMAADRLKYRKKDERRP